MVVMEVFILVVVLQVIWVMMVGMADGEMMVVGVEVMVTVVEDRGGSWGNFKTKSCGV